MRIPILLLVALACGCRPHPPDSPRRADAAVPVTVATATRADVPIEARAVGTVEPVASVAIKPQVAGIVAEVRFEEGADVRAGDPLLQLDPRPFEAAVQAAEADLLRDRALADDAKSAADQIEGAREKSAVSKRTAEQARASAAAAEATVRKDEAALATARLELEHCSIRAPFDGRTGILAVRRGSVVKENETELVSVHQIVPIRVSFTVPEKHLAEIRRAAAAGALPVRAQVAGSEAPAEGVLTFLDNEVDRTSGTIRLMATFANEDRRLWPGQFVQVLLTTSVDRDVVVVPSRAVQTGQEGDYVFVVGDDSAVEVRRVRVARSAGDRSVLADGLVGGETVVTDGQLRLVPGSRVAPREPPQPEAR